MNNSKPSIKSHQPLNLNPIAKPANLLKIGTAANEHLFYDLKPLNVVAYNHEFQILKKNRETQPFNRLPFKITGNDEAVLELFMTKLSKVLGVKMQSLWTEMVNNIEDYYCAFEVKELKLKQHLIFDLINLGNGEVTLEAIGKLVEIKRKLLVPEYLDLLIAHK
ncbi:hypothetical protein [Pseudoalteromonas luteoviolacea]|uniref:Uncharacterized protein n=1 Tax=Pseudoalteromonas luteoviolacea NCIMB 1942 TaxID=1365253 RepID=A0A161YA57_9GAMM|nr:hypothetical protein [Pseudoalteromonas luteoviolacea]KZN53963.1 hypothetical protein N482_24740 [Pseudoalteromonas luteoviolacea NCIMB 1942]KZX01390.1 hypothetical protein JL49_06015 [Pseudoalteromonas luteoviolacea]